MEAEERRKLLAEVLSERVPEAEPGPGRRAARGAAARVLKRLGLVPAGARKREVDEAVEGLCDELSRSTGVDAAPGAVREALALYATGEGAPCGRHPACGRCELKHICRHVSKRPTLKDIPEDDRPRERLLRRGQESLSDAELLAIIIRDGTQERSALELAQELLKRFGDLRSIALASAAELAEVKGIGPAKAAQILAAAALGCRIAQVQLEPGRLCDSPEQVFSHFKAMFRDLKQETFHVILLDTKHRFIGAKCVFRGTLNLSTVHPRELFAEALSRRAAAVIFVHNHPSGDPPPSREDYAVTERLKKVGQLMGIPALDHIIVAGERYVSMADLGAL